MKSTSIGSLHRAHSLPCNSTAAALSQWNTNICFKLVAILLLCNQAIAASPPTSERDFKAYMVKTHQFEAAKIDEIFQAAEVKDSILEAINRPYEAKPWHSYRKIFLTEPRILAGIEFWQSHQSALEKISNQHGLPIEIIVAIIGVETSYGRITGNYRVLDALFTLAFNYPKRSAFFSRQLEEFLLLCREEKLVPTELKGSYAGAMGIPQFMPGSFRQYASDFDGDNLRDIWTNPGDAIASVGNYFKQHGWVKNAPVISAVQKSQADFSRFKTSGLKLDTRLSVLRSHNIIPQANWQQDAAAKLIELEEAKDFSYWIALKNFYVITRYNHSAHYAMAVYQLGQAIKARRKK